MAIIVGKEQKIPFSGALKDSRAEGYVSYFTKAGWDRWKMAAASVERDIADRDKQYTEAMNVYEKQLNDIAKTKDGLAKKIADIQAKAADANIRREDAYWKAETRRQEKRQEQETEREKGIAKKPSTSESRGASYTGSGGGVYSGRGGSGKDPFDEAMDEITSANRQGVDDRLRSLSQGGINSSNVGDKWIKLNQLQNTVLNVDPYTKGMTAYALFKTSTDALRVENPSMSDDDLTAKVLGVMSPGQQADVAYGKSMVDKKAADQAGGGGGGGTYSPSSGGSTGSYQTDYNIAEYEEMARQAEADGLSYKQIEDDLTKKLENVDKQKLTVPTFEKIDLITATRKTYDDKFGDIPKGTMLQTASGNTYKSELQPYELTNAIKQSEKFFKLYIDDEVNAATLLKGSPLNTDEQDAAVEAGKKRARGILFGGFAQKEEQKAADTGTSPLPNAGDPNDVIQFGESIPTINAKETLPEFAPSTPTIDEPAVLTDERIKEILDAVDKPGANPIGSLIQDYTPNYTPNRQAEFDALKFTPSTPTINAKETLPEFLPSTPYRSTGTPDFPLTIEERTRIIEDAIDLPGTNLLGSLIQSYTPATPEGYRSPNESYSKDTWKQEGYIEPTKEEIDSQLYWKNKSKEEQKTPPANSQDLESLNDRKNKTEAVIAGSSLAIENPKKAAATVTKDSIGKYVASLYDTNKEKGVSGSPVGKISETILREYSSDPAKQKKALEILASLSVLDSSAGKIRAV